MHPSRYPFVVNGPRCLCGHRRLAHVGVHPRYKMTTYDMACSTCAADGRPVPLAGTACERYTPMESIDPVEEAAQIDEMYQRGERRRRIQRVALFVLLAVTVVTVVLTAFNRDAFPWLFMPLIALSATNMVVTAIFSWRDSHETFDLVLEIGLAVWLIVFFAVLGVGVPSPVVVAVLALGGCGLVGFAVRTQRDLKRSMTVLERFSSDLTNPPHEP